MSDNIDKWNHRYQYGMDTLPEPALVLKENQHLLPAAGAALDLACGLGGNALYMSRKGLKVSAWDYSPVAIDKLTQLAETEDLNIQTSVRDIVQDPPEAESFDVIVVSHFLDRSVNQTLIEALKPDGILFYQTYTKNKVINTGPDNPDYLLLEGELLDMFKALKVRVYREEGGCGNIKKGLRNEALFIGQKPG